MKLSIPTKLFFAVLSACTIMLVVKGVAERISFERVFLDYINEQGVQRMEQIADSLASEHRKYGNWEFLRGKPDMWFQLVRPEARNSDRLQDHPPVSDQTGVIMRLALFDEQGQRLLGNPAAVGKDAIRRQVIVDGSNVGWLAMVPLEKAVDEGDVRFYQAQQRSWWINITAAIGVAALLAWILSQALLGRLQTLTGGIHKLAAGDYTTRIVGTTDDDQLDQLAQDINRLADVLEHTDRSRRDFMADISHELRTPLAVLRAELEAVQDGIRPLQPGSLTPLLGQVEQLGKLIDDLHDLSMTQAEPSVSALSTAPLCSHGL
jgi:two-component system sensor histidine kinase BaeS